MGLHYWSLNGSGDGGKATIAQGAKGPPTSQLAEDALNGLQSLIQSFHDETTPYIGSPISDRMIKPDFNDYAHLERIDEWSVTGDEGEAA